MLQRMDQGDNLELTGNCCDWPGVESFDAWDRFQRLLVTVIDIQTCQRPTRSYLIEGSERSAVAATYIQQPADPWERKLLLKPVK